MTVDVVIVLVVEEVVVEVVVVVVVVVGRHISANIDRCVVLHRPQSDDIRTLVMPSSDHWCASSSQYTQASSSSGVLCQRGSAVFTLGTFS